MNIEHLNYLVTVADCGSIHEASRQLLLKQQYVSNVIKSLESHFGVQIFNRQSKGVTPTADGQYLINSARQLLTLYNAMESNVAYPTNTKSLDSHEAITIYLPTYLDTGSMLSTVTTFKTYFPNIEISLSSKEPKDFFATVYDEPNSVAIYPTHIAQEIFQATLPADLRFQPLESISLSLLTSSSNEDAKKYDAIAIQDALNLPLVFYAPQGLAHAPIYQALCTFGKPHVHFIVDNPVLLYRLLQKEHCYTIANQHILQENPSILAIPFQETIDLNTFLIYHQQAINSYALRCLIRLLRNITLTN